MTKDSYCEISEYFGIPTVEQLIANRHDRFLSRFGVKEIMYAKHWLCSLSLLVSFLVLLLICIYYFMVAFMVALCNRETIYIFILFLSSFFFLA